MKKLFRSCSQKNWRWKNIVDILLRDIVEETYLCCLIVWSPSSTISCGSKVFVYDEHTRGCWNWYTLSLASFIQTCLNVHIAYYMCFWRNCFGSCFSKSHPFWTKWLTTLRLKFKGPCTCYKCGLTFFYLCSTKAIQCKGPFSKCLCNFDEGNQHKFLQLEFFCQFWTSLSYHVITKFIEIVSIMSIFVQPQNFNLSPI